MSIFSKIKRHTWGWLLIGSIVVTLLGYGLKYVFEKYEESKETSD